MQQTKWKENIILVDANYLDDVVFDLIVNFEPMINRSIPYADLCRWLDCIALDGGLRPKEDNQVQVVFIHEQLKEKFSYLKPSSFSKELDAKAFKDNVAEFELISASSEDIVTKDELFLQSLELIVNETSVKNLMVVADELKYGERARNLFVAARGKDITYFSMQPVKGGRFFQEILGYSLMNALGIKSDEIK